MSTSSNVHRINPNRFGFTLDERVIKAGGGGVITAFPVTPGGVLTFPAPTPLPPAPVQPVSPTASASDLQIMMAAIPIAQDGHVITAEYHNSLRLALVAIANRLGIGPVSEEITITNAPRLITAANSTGWEHDFGMVVRRVSGTTAGTQPVRGWMELELPEGARIKKLMVFGTTKGAGTLKAKLKRQKITDPTIMVDLVVIEIPNGFDTTKGIEGDVTVPGTGAGNLAIDEFRIVNNREHKYLFTLELEGIGPDTQSQFHSIQIVCAW